MTNISPWFGIIALTNTAGFITLGVSLPWLLAEGLQGASIVTAGNTTRVSFPEVALLAMQLDLRDTVRDIYSFCNPYYTRWKEKCDNIRRGIPIIQKKMLSLDGALLSSPEYEFLITNAATGSLIRHSSQRVTLEHVGVNQNSKMNIRHQFACVPADLNRFILREGRRHRISLLPENFNQSLPQRIDNVTWDMPLFTSNEFGSGRIVRELNLSVKTHRLVLGHHSGSCYFTVRAKHSVRD